MADCCDDQNPFECPICLQLLKDPVTTACGHSFCMNCIKECWDLNDEKGVYSCPQCRQIFTPRPALNRSTILAELIEKMKKETPQAVEAAPASGSVDVECDICMENKLKAVKFCLVCVVSYCETHIQTHYTSPALKRHKLVNASPHLQGQICAQHDKPLELYCCQDQQLICMQCALINHQNHSMASPAAKRQEIQGQLKSNQHGLQEEIHQRVIKVQEIIQAIGSHKQSAQAAVEHGEKIFTELISSYDKKRAEITEKISNQEKAEERKAKELIHSLEQEISDLRRRNEELGQLSQIDDDIYFIQNFSSITNYQCSDLCTITINQHPTFGEIQPILSELKSQLDDLCEQDTVRISEKVPTAWIILNDEKIPKYLPSQPKTREEFLIYFFKLCLNQQSACNSLSLSNSYVSRSNCSQSASHSLFGSPHGQTSSGFDASAQLFITRQSNTTLSSRRSSSGRFSSGGSSLGGFSSGGSSSGGSSLGGFAFAGSSSGGSSLGGFSSGGSSSGGSSLGGFSSGGSSSGGSSLGGFVFGESSSCGSSFGVSTIQTRTYQVLCNTSLSGCCYFEVEYTGTGCSIAFTYDQFNQAGGSFKFGCNDRSWMFDFSNACINKSHKNISTSIPIVSSKIGVYLDHNAGSLSFYSVSDKMTLLHRVQTTFTEPIYPGFSLEKWANGSVSICDLSLKPK